MVVVWDSLGSSRLGSFSTVIATLAVSLLMMYALKYIKVLRVSKEGELEGLDLHEHGAVAYPEYALMSIGDALTGPNGHSPDGALALDSVENASIGD